MTEKNIYQKLYKNKKEYEAAIKLDKEKYSAKIKLEAKVEKEMREVFKGELHNNETFYLMVKKLVPILDQLPQEPVLNEYLDHHLTNMVQKFGIKDTLDF
tara:strand:+ start:489 stop:788 length:300 start_codon:yes stop_codon:yes gene_type:complete